MPKLLIITHPEVTIDPHIPVTDWGLSAAGRDCATAFASNEVVAQVRDIWSSDEQKARETAEILAATRKLSVKHHPGLGENDRSATGFLPPEEFETAAGAFFARPEVSHCGWETATDAQTRILRAVTEIVGTHDNGDLAIVTHGAVGTLLWCAFSSCPIDRKYDQPSQGHFWQANLSSLRPLSGWVPMA